MLEKRPYKTSVFLKFDQENVCGSADTNFIYWNNSGFFM